MAIWDGVKRQLRSVIEWENPDPNALFQQWTENGDEIKNASKLIVGPGQGVIFVYEGKVQAVHTEEGMYDLKTANIPFFTTVIKIMQAFESEHKVGIYFFRTTEFLNQKWGTSAPIVYDDPIYEFPVKLRSFGNFSFKMTSAESFFVNVLGERESVGIDEIRDLLMDRLTQPMTDFLAESGFSYAQIDKNRNEIAQGVGEMANQVFREIGFEMTDFRIESTNFDPETEERIARIANITAEARAAEKAGISYTEMQKLEALKDAAKNEGGIAGLGVGMGAGMSFGQMMGAGMMGGQMGGMMGGVQAPELSSHQNTSVQPSLTNRLAELKKMKDMDLISQDEFDAKKQEILSQL